MRVSLAHYLHQRRPEASLDTSSHHFAHFLRQVTLDIDADAKVACPTIHRIEPDDDYFEALPVLVQFLRHDRRVAHLDNSLALYRYGDKDGEFHYNDAVTNMLSGHWRHVYELLGRDEFVRMVVNYKAYIRLDDGRQFQVFGPKPWALALALAPAALTSLISDQVRAKQLQQRRYLLRPPLIPPNNTNALIGDGFRRYGKRINDGRLLGILRKHVPQQQPPPVRTCDVVASGQLGSDNYGDDDDETFTQPPPNPDDDNAVLKYLLAPKGVVLYVLHVLRMVVPQRAWGTGAQRRKLSHLVFQFITNPSTVIVASDITTCFAPAPVTNDVVEFWMWVFRDVIGCILRRQLRVAPIKATVCFFDHTSWKRLLDWFIDGYAREFFEPFSPLSFVPRSVAESLNFGSMRLVPKPLDFRLICIPLRRPWDKLHIPDELQYFGFRARWIRPIKYFLRQRIESRYHRIVAPCTSTADLTPRLAQWKLTVTIPRDGVSFLRVDFAKCYDRLDHDVLIDILKQLFDDVDDDHVFYYDQIGSCNTTATTLTLTLTIPPTRKRTVPLATIVGALQLATNTKPIVLPNVVEIPREAKKSRSKAVSRNPIHRKTKQAILEFCELMIRDAFMYDGQLPSSRNRDPKIRAWKRKKGVFQGFPLLATFCELVLNHMVVTEFDSWLSRPDLLVLRVVDDLLFVSTDPLMMELIYQQLTSDRLAHYGIKVNHKKTQLHIAGSDIISHIDYLGAEINPYDLSVNVKNRPKLNLCSFKQFFRGLLFQYKTAVGDIEYRLSFVLDSIKRHFVTLRDHDQFNVDDFTKFIRSIIEATAEIDEAQMATLLEEWLYVEELNGTSFAVAIAKALDENDKIAA